MLKYVNLLFRFPNSADIGLGSIHCRPDLRLSVLRHGQVKYSVSVVIDVVISNSIENIWTFKHLSIRCGKNTGNRSILHPYPAYIVKERLHNYLPTGTIWHLRNDGVVETGSTYVQGKRVRQWRRGDRVMEEEGKEDDRDAGWKIKIRIKYEKMKLEGKVDCMFL